MIVIICGLRQLSKLMLKIFWGAKDLIISGDVIAADVVAMNLAKRYDDSFTSDNEAIIRRKHEHGEELALETGDFLRWRS